MSELVAMKGTKSGIVIVLNEEAAFEELKQIGRASCRERV